MIHLFDGKIKSITIVSILLFSVQGISQEINFGAKAGLNISCFRGDYPDAIDDKKPVIGFHIGGFAEYSANEKIAVQPELLFSRQGVTTKVVENGASSTQSPRYNYLNLAILGKYKVLKKLSIEFGPQIGYVLTAKSKWA